jgi:hypothetical protein
LTHSAVPPHAPQVLCAHNQASRTPTKAGKQVAALIDIETLERLRKLDEEFEQLRAELARSFEKLPETEGVKVADEACGRSGESDRPGTLSSDRMALEVQLKGAFTSRFQLSAGR